MYKIDTTPDIIKCFHLGNELHITLKDGVMSIKAYYPKSFIQPPNIMTDTLFIITIDLPIETDVENGNYIINNHFYRNTNLKLNTKIKLKLTKIFDNSLKLELIHYANTYKYKIPRTFLIDIFKEKGE